jgi:hypothetical protein
LIAQEDLKVVEMTPKPKISEAQKQQMMYDQIDQSTLDTLKIKKAKVSAQAVP